MTTATFVLPEGWVTANTDVEARVDLHAHLPHQQDTGLNAHAALDALLDGYAAASVRFVASVQFGDAGISEDIASAAFSIATLPCPASLTTSAIGQLLGGQALSGWPRTVGIVSAGAGEAVRERSIGPIPGLELSGLSPVVATYRLLLPIVTEGILLVLTLDTPSVAYLEEFDRLFDALVGTLRLERLPSPE
jgi:hypothetical protein